MKRILFSLAGVLALSGVAGAQQPGYGGVMPANYMGGGVGPMANPYAMPMPGPAVGDKAEASRFGYNPIIKRLFNLKSDCGSGNCNSCSKGGAAGGQAGGTLVFPNQPFIRSPRDFFMEER